MKYKLLRYSLLSLLVMLCGNVFAQTGWVKTAPTDLKTGDVVVIVDQTSKAAMSNNNGTTYAPAATPVELSGDMSQLTGDVSETLQWVVTVDGGNYKFNVPGTEDFVYCTNTNNGVRVGTSENNVFTITQGGDNEADFLVNTATSRFIGVYNNQDWRCYATINNNIKGCVTAFYKKGGSVAPVAVETPVITPASGVYYGTQTVSIACATEGATIYYTIDDSNYNEYKAPFSVTETTTIRAYAQKGSDKSATGISKLTIAPVYTSIADMLANCTDKKTDVKYTFENLLVTYVNGKYTYVNDGTNGFLLFGEGLGMETGSTYKGSAAGQLYGYYNLPELQVSNIEVTKQSEGNNVPVSTIAPADLESYINQMVKIENAVFGYADKQNLYFSVGETEFIARNAFNVNADDLEAGKSYTLNGVGSLYNTTAQIYLISFEETSSEAGYTYHDFAVTLTDASIFDTSVNNFGVKVAADGTYSATAADDNTANFFVNSARFNDSQHGWVDCVFTIPVPGAVKIELGDCQYGGQNGTITDAAGNETEIKANASKACWTAGAPHDKVVVAYYAGTEATTLTVKYKGYCPFIAVTAIDPSDIPSESVVTFSAADAEGVAPVSMKVAIGGTITIPANTTLYKEGYTLSAWTDGKGAQYKAGDVLTVSNDITLTPVFTSNAIAFADRTAETTLTWQFGEKNGVGPLNAQGKKAILVTQATIGGNIIDVKMDIDATSGKINNVGRGDEWAQCNDGTILTIPAYKGMNVSFKSYGDASGTTIGGTEATDKSAVYEGSAATIDIVAKAISYISNVVAVYPVPSGDEPAAFQNFAVQLTNSEIFDTGNNKFGVKVAKDGTYTATAFDDPEANFTVSSARFNDAQHGWVNCVFTIPVTGPVKVGLGNCQYGAQDGTITDAAGNVTALTVGNKNCWAANNIEGTTSYTIYKGLETTILTIKYNGYCPFISVEAVDPSELKSDATVTFAAGEAEGGLVPEAIKKEVGKAITLPQNFTLYVEGKTLTAWTDGTNDYAPGAEYTVPENDVTLTAKFTTNEVSLSDRSEAATLNFTFRRDQGAPTVAWQNQDAQAWVTQAVVNGKTIDVAAMINTKPGKFANGNWNDWAQLNGGTTITIPSCKGAVVSVEAYNELGTGDQPLTIDGQSDYTSGKTISYTVAGGAETVDVVIGTEGSYYRYVKVVLPVVEQQGGKTFNNEAAQVVWPLNDASAVSTYSAQPADAFTTVALNTGDLEITGAATRTADSAAEGITFVKFKPSGSTKAVEWVVKPAAGLTFTPTKVSMWIQRFGTDAENGVTVTAKVGEGEAITLGNYTAPRANQPATGDKKDKFAGNSNYTNQVVIELSAEQQAALASGEGLTLAATVGVGSSKEGGFSDVHIEGLVNGTKADVALYALSAVAQPAEAGSINVYPAAEQYEEGTEVTLTATENFGYDFVNWTNAAGEEVSTEAKFKYTVTANETLTANFKAVPTYELALTVDGTNDYMVTVNPAPTIVDGRWMYEEGQGVQLAANQYEGLVTFTNWNDGETTSTKTIMMNEDTQVTAYYAEADIIAGWDFYLRGGDGRKADFYAQDNDADALSLVNTETGETSGWLDKSTEAAGGYESFKGAAVNWRTGASNGDVGNWHWQTKVNAEAFTDINVQFQMLYNYNAYQTYDVEYSLNGTEWSKAGSITMTGAKAEASFSGKLPEAANNQKDLFIRMKADKTSKVDGASSANDGNSLAMFFITGTPKMVDDGKAPVLVSSVPADGANGVSASGKIVLTFDERVKLAEGVKGMMAVDNGMEGAWLIEPTVSGKTITFEYKGLEYASPYKFTLGANSVSDLTDNYMENPITLSFTTMVRPSVTKGLYDAVVENVEQLMAAINKAEARADKNVRFRIFIKNGEYTIPLSSTMKTVNGYDVPECITFINSGNISFIGESRDGVIITNGIDKNETFAGQYGTTSKYDGIGNSDVFQIKGSDYYFQDLTIESGMDDATGRDLAVQDKATRTIYKNTGLRGYQDTWTSNNDNGLYYFEGGYVRGRTDYMCGKGDAFFNGVEIRQIYGGYAAVPSKSIKYGYVYKDCVINGEPGVAGGKNYTATQVDGNYTLGRPWGSGTPSALFIDTRMNVVPSAIGWNEMSGGWPKRFAEYNSMTSTGTQIDLSGRKKVFGDGHENNPVLSAEEAYEAGNLHNMFGEWDPTLLSEQAPAPKNVAISGNTLTWDNSDYAFCWAVVKNGSVVEFTTEPTYTVDDASATWSVRAANEMGGLGEAVVAVSDSDKPLEIALNVDRYTGMGYNPTEATVDFNEAKTYLGVEEVTTSMLRIVNPDGTMISDYTPFDGWFNGDGVAETWGSNTKICVKFFQAIPNGKFEICDMNGADEVGKSYTVTWAIEANEKKVLFPITVTFTKPEEVKPEIIATIDVPVSMKPATPYEGATATFDAAEVAGKLGITTIADAQAFIVNVTTGDFVPNSTDGWRDAQGDAATWGSGAGMVCVKINDPASGTIDYLGAIDDTYKEGDKYTAKWGFVNKANKAVVLNVNITFTDPSGLNDPKTDISNGTVYNMQGQKVNKTKKGLYIINGKKVIK